MVLARLRLAEGHSILRFSGLCARTRTSYVRPMAPLLERVICY